MNVKEDIVELLRDEGYDFFSACEIAEKLLARVKKSPDGKYRFISRGHVVEIEKRTRKEIKG